MAFSPLLGLPATLVAAVLERPFISRAGIQRYALTRSIRANLLSWLVGLFFVFLLESNQVAVMLAILYFILAIPISILIEGGYYWAILNRRGGGLRWRWVIAGNIVSAAFLMSLSFVPGILRSEYPRLEFMVEPHEETVRWLLAAICLAWWCLHFGRSAKGGRPIRRQANWPRKPKRRGKRSPHHDPPARANDPRKLAPLPRRADPHRGHLL